MGVARLAAKAAQRGTPDREQFRLPRYEPPRGKPASLTSKVIGKRNADRLKRLVEQGLERGGGEWYHTGPIFDEFVAVLGPERGTAAFDRYIDFVAATSPRSRVDANIKRASLLYGKERQGQQFVGLENKDFPKGYGHLAHKTQDHLIRDLAEGRSFEALHRPKTSSFAENLKGNLEPMTIDTHNRAAVFNDRGGKSPTNTEYLYLEDFQRKLADELGIAPAEWQSALWVGADKITGVADSRPFVELFDESVTRTAELQGKTKRQVIRDFVEGKAPLASILAATGVMSSGEAKAAAKRNKAIEGSMAGPEAVYTMASGMLGELLGLASRAGGVINPFNTVDESRKIADALAAAFQHTPSPAAAELLSPIGTALEEAEKGVKDFWGRIPGHDKAEEAWNSLHPRIREALMVASDLAL